MEWLNRRISYWSVILLFISVSFCILYAWVFFIIFFLLNLVAGMLFLVRIQPWIFRIHEDDKKKGVTLLAIWTEHAVCSYICSRFGFLILVFYMDVIIVGTCLFRVYIWLLHSRYQLISQYSILQNIIDMLKGFQVVLWNVTSDFVTSIDVVCGTFIFFCWMFDEWQKHNFIKKSGTQLKCWTVYSLLMVLIISINFLNVKPGQ
jgi:hypothetical protein